MHVRSRSWDVPLLKCPTCGVCRSGFTMVSVETAVWSDECGCHDRESCLYHRLHPEEQPRRPSDEVVLSRAKAQMSSKDREIEALSQKFKIMESMPEDLRDASDLLRQYKDLYPENKELGQKTLALLSRIGKP